MLSIKALGSAKQAGSYYKDADYYGKNENGEKEVIPSEWVGKGAALMGLEGPVDIKVFQQALEGRLPTGDTLGRSDGKGGLEHKPGWDFTFSAPKSVSIMALMGGDERLMAAHKEAVKSAVGYIEDRLVGARNTSEGVSQFVRTENLAAATFTHTTSRALDPQLHTHSVILNATLRNDGQWRSIESRKMYDPNVAAGQVYRSELAMKAQELGYTIERGKNGTFELQEVSQELRDLYSKRRKDIEAAAKERGLEGAKAMDRASLMTRDSKQSTTEDVLQERWRSELQEARLTVPTIPEARPSAERDSPDRAKDDAIFAYKKLAEREAVFSEGELVKMTLAWGVGNHSIKDVEQALRSLKQEKVLLHATGVSRDEAYLTTPQALKKERYIVDLVKTGQNELKPISGKGAVKEYGQSLGFTRGQMEGATTILSGKDRVVGVQGYAGTGKTYMLSAVREVAEGKGYSVRGFAPTGSASDSLMEGSGIRSQTLASHLYALAREEEGKGGKGLDQKKLWIVDEGSLVNANQMADLLTYARKEGARVALVGDHAQIGSVEWGKPFAQLVRGGMKTAQMTEIQRQKNNPILLQAVKDAMVGQVAKAMKNVAGRIHEDPNRETLVTQVIDDYAGITARDRSDTLLMVPDNETRAVVNQGIREKLQQSGDLGKDKAELKALVSLGLTRVEKGSSRGYQKGDLVQFARDFKTIGVERNELVKVLRVDGEKVIFANKDGQEVEWRPDKVAGRAKHGVEVYREEDKRLAEGDRIRWTKTDKDRDLKNGAKGEIERIDGSTAIIKFQDGRRISLDLKEDKHWDHAYASTIVSAQGQTYKSAMALAESWRRNLVNQKSFYVGLSRAKEDARIYTDDRAKLTKGIEERTGEKTSALEGRNVSVEKMFAADGLVKETRMEKVAQKVKDVFDKTFGKAKNSPDKGMSL
ncbi:relaxase domain-containing protein (plasmid) [Marinobacter sp. MA]|uniref:MobF family relaxase n=1 Tax=Marinobacter sp. MA TaxID=2971606 RepID=UPI003AAD790F